MATQRYETLDQNRRAAEAEDLKQLEQLERPLEEKKEGEGNP